MILERTQDEIIVRLPANMDLTELQDMIDFLKYKELTLNSEAKLEDVNELSKTVNKSIWAKVKSERGLR